MARGFMGRRSQTLRRVGWDYSAQGSYFVTVCVQSRLETLSVVMGRSIELTERGRIVAFEWRRSLSMYDGIRPDRFVVMPDHIQGLVHYARGNFEGRPTLGDLVGTFKRAACRRLRLQRDMVLLWQPGYYDQIIRGRTHLETVRDYILRNPVEWHLKRMATRP